MVLHIPTDDMTMVKSILHIQSICITQSPFEVLQFSGKASFFPCNECIYKKLNIYIWLEMLVLLLAVLTWNFQADEVDWTKISAWISLESNLDQICFYFIVSPIESLHILTRPHILSIKGYNLSEQVNKIRGFFCFQTLKMKMFYHFKAYTLSSIIWWSSRRTSSLDDRKGWPINVSIWSY